MTNNIKIKSYTIKIYGRMPKSPSKPSALINNEVNG